MTKFVATLRNIEVLFPKKAYAVTVVVTKEKGGILVGGSEIPGEQVELTLNEIEQFVEQRLNAEYDEHPEAVDSTTRPSSD